MLAKRLFQSAALVVFATVLVPMLAGCTSEQMYHNVVDFRKKHPITVNQKTVEHTFYLGSDGALQTSDIERVEFAASNYVAKGEGNIEIQMPFAPDRKDYAKKRAHTIATMFNNHGVDRSKLYMRLVPRDSDRVWPSGKENTGEHYHPVYVRYDVFEADVPECGDFSSMGTAGRKNQVTHNYGCATQRNIGLMVANPHDLVKMRPMEGRSGARAANVMNGYVSGGITASVAPVQAVVDTGN